MAKDEKRQLRTSSTMAALLAFVDINLLATGFMPNDAPKKLDKNKIARDRNEKRQEGNWIWWVTRDYLMDGQGAEVVFMGSSQMGSALYAAEAQFLNRSVDVVRERRSRCAESSLEKKLGFSPTTFNLSLGGAMVSDQYLIAKTMFNRQNAPKVVVVGVNPRDFIDNQLPSAAATDTFRYLNSYVDLGSLAYNAFPDPFDWINFEINKKLPAKVIGDKWKSELSNTVIAALTKGDSSYDTVTSSGAVSKGGETTAQTQTTDQTKSFDGDLLKAIYGGEGSIKPGAWNIKACNWGAFKDNTAEYTARYENACPPIYPGQKAFFKSMLSDFKKENIKVLVVGMPSLWPNRALLPDQFWGEFRQFVSSSCTEYGATWLDLTDDNRFDAKDYLDTVHLDSAGGQRLVDIIASTIAANDQLASGFKNPSIAERDSNQAWH